MWKMGKYDADSNVVKEIKKTCLAVQNSNLMSGLSTTSLKWHIFYFKFIQTKKETECLTLTVSGVSKMEIISTSISIPGWKTGSCVTYRFNLPTRPSIFFLSRSVLSIIHEMCLLFFLDRAQHNTSPTAWLPSLVYKLANPMREQWVLPTAQLHQWSHTECVTAISHLNFTNTTAPRL